MFDIPKGLGFFVCLLLLFLFISFESAWIKLWTFIACQGKKEQQQKKPHCIETTNPNFVFPCRTTQSFMFVLKYPVEKNKCYFKIYFSNISIVQNGWRTWSQTSTRKFEAVMWRKPIKRSTFSIERYVISRAEFFL